MLLNSNGHLAGVPCRYRENGAVVFSCISTNPHPAGYAYGFVVTGIINLGMLVIASALLFFVPKSRGRDIPRGEPLLVEG